MKLQADAAIAKERADAAKERADAALAREQLAHREVAELKNDLASAGKLYLKIDCLLCVKKYSNNLSDNRWYFWINENGHRSGEDDRL